MTDTRVMIEVEHLARLYGDVRAVDAISFTVLEGEIFGLLGHNGAGKTTTIRMLTGRTRPTAGSAHIAGYDVLSELEHVTADRRMASASSRMPTASGLMSPVVLRDVTV